MSQIFGPVPSRRLGFSLGIDTVPYKTCSLDCIYCQLGKTTNKTIERKEYISCEDILPEIEEILKQKKKIDYITFSGSGEPTLNSGIKTMINNIKKLTSIPIAVLTNGTLLFQPEIREELMEADLVIPSLDAVSEEVFKKVNRPHYSLKIDKIIDGLSDFSQEFKGKIWLEIMIVKGTNDSPQEIKRMTEVIEKIKLDKIQLNTVVRPPTEEFAQPVNLENLKKIKRTLGEKCEIIAGFKRPNQEFYSEDIEKGILTMVKRRPVTLLDISHSLGIHQNEAIKYLNILEKEGQILTRVYREKRYYYVEYSV
jgi:wyosine [tRNA(Phe)-imidazoG37] synthetase (radical SAM superfamily)